MRDGEATVVLPLDLHNKTLVSHVHPPEYKNPDPGGGYDLVVIGGGTGGLVTAVGASSLGAKVAMVEKHLLGGDCLNVGCVPSKAIIRSARAAAAVKDAGKYGVTAGSIKINFGAVMERMRRLRASISPHDSVKRINGLGVDVFLGQAKFRDRRSIDVNGVKLDFKKAVIATGARAFEPDVPGLRECGFLTNETVFSLTERPGHLLVVGAGPIGSELSQAFARLGSQVTLLEMGPQFLPREDPDAVEVLRAQFVKDDIKLIFNSRMVKVIKVGHQSRVFVEVDGKTEEILVDKILIGAGRVPNVEGIGLEAAGVEFDTRKGVRVDSYLRTTNKKIFAVGDVALPYKFTHTADAAARIVIQNALFPTKRKWGVQNIPWCTYTDPEIAHVGLYEKDAKDQGIEIDTYKRVFADVDRAILEGATEGFVKIHTKKGTDKILGATIVAEHAGEMISEISVAMAARFGLGQISGVIHPYPTQAEAIRQTGDLYRKTLLTPGVRKFLNFMRKLTR